MSDVAKAKLAEEIAVKRCLLVGRIWRDYYDFTNSVHEARTMERLHELERILDSRDANMRAQPAAQAVPEAVAIVRQREPYADGSPCDGHILEWCGRNAEDDLPVGTMLYAAPTPPAVEVRRDLLDWAVTSWHEQVAQRPLVNVYRRTLDSVWRQVITFAGGDAESLIGPRHDDLLDERGEVPKLPPFPAQEVQS